MRNIQLCCHEASEVPWHDNEMIVAGKSYDRRPNRSSYCTPFEDYSRERGIKELQALYAKTCEHVVREKNSSRARQKKMLASRDIYHTIPDYANSPNGAFWTIIRVQATVGARQVSSENAGLHSHK